jgi:hypothetical protein
MDQNDFVRIIVVVVFFLLNFSYLIKDIGRILIPRFFRTLFDGGISEVYFLFKQTKEIFHSPTISIDCEQGSLVTCFGKPSFIKVKITKKEFSQDIFFLLRFVPKDILILNLHLMI